MDGWLGICNTYSVNSYGNKLDSKNDHFGSGLFTNDVINLKHQGACQKLMIGWHKHQGVSETPKNADVICEQPLKTNQAAFAVSSFYAGFLDNCKSMNDLKMFTFCSIFTRSNIFSFSQPHSYIFWWEWRRRLFAPSTRKGWSVLRWRWLW